MAHPTRGDPVRFLADGGAPERAADHSLEGFELARRLGADGWEVSGHLSVDGVVVVARSATVGWRRRPRSALAAADGLTLDDLLALDTASEPLVSVRVEGRRALDAVAVASVGAAATERTWVRCGDMEVLAGFAADVGPSRPRLLHEAPLAAMADGPERHAARLRDAGIDGQAMAFGQWTGGLTALFHRFGLLCSGRGAVHVRMIREFVAMGLDSVAGTHPDRLAEARRAPGTTP